MSIPMLEPWIETHQGHKFYFLDPDPDTITIEDIAHSLSNQCRFSGHLNKFYSVAEHSILVSKITSIYYGPEYALAGLMHDASEAYLLDIPSPIKMYLTNYKDMEDKIMEVIAKKFNFMWPMQDYIKDADHAQLIREAKDLLPSQGASWIKKFNTGKAHGIKPYCWTSATAKRFFLDRFHDCNTHPFYTGVQQSA